MTSLGRSYIQLRILTLMADGEQRDTRQIVARAGHSRSRVRQSIDDLHGRGLLAMHVRGVGYARMYMITEAGRALLGGVDARQAVQA